MKITQEKPEFKPITIVIETREEAEAFWRAILGTLRGSDMDFVNRVSDWFSQEASL